jgi:hypothetical protein
LRALMNRVYMTTERFPASGLPTNSQFFLLCADSHKAKNWLFLGNEESGQKCAILYTIVENCRRLGINPKEYLTDVLIRLPAMKANEAVGLIPANWLKARSRKPERMAA